jgi:hypothetical protein
MFGRSVGSHAEVGVVRPEQVSAFLAEHGPITRYWFAKYAALRGWFGLTVAPARPCFGLYSSPDGLYIPGTGMLFRRR